ncbi:hypothetical protein C8J57DRAFT_1348709 [Mycena rebaudengoi]|nr:hypothetical protein C8J57DRAFT_1348709 [Mycena rebaudengoi]
MRLFGSFVAPARSCLALELWPKCCCWLLTASRSIGEGTPSGGGLELVSESVDNLDNVAGYWSAATYVGPLDWSGSCNFE